MEIEWQSTGRCSNSGLRTHLWDWAYTVVRSWDRDCRWQKLMSLTPCDPQSSTVLEVRIWADFIDTAQPATSVDLLEEATAPLRLLKDTIYLMWAMLNVKIRELEDKHKVEYKKPVRECVAFGISCIAYSTTCSHLRTTCSTVSYQEKTWRQ